MQKNPCDLYYPMKNEDTKYAAVVEALRQDIRRGLLAPGTRLPGQNVLGERYGVSPITSKRALAELERQGYIERKPRSGSYVRATPRIFSEINIVIGGKIINESLWLSDYWKGIEQEAVKLGIPVQVMRTSAPGFAARVPQGDPEQGVVLLGFEDPDLIGQLRARKIPHVVGVSEAHHSPYNVLVNYRRTVVELVNVMYHHGGCRRMHFLGNLTQPSHCLARDGFAAALDELDFTGRMIHVEDESIQDELRRLLAGDPRIDGMVVMGGGLPFRALPVLLQSGLKIQLGALTENRTIMELRGSAYIADYSLLECGRLLFRLLYESAVNRELPATTRYPEFQILPPDSGGR